jgi:hypothetical protein
MTPERIDDPRDQAAQPSAAANAAIALLLQSWRPAGRVAELGSLIWLTKCQAGRMIWLPIDHGILTDIT